MNLFDKVMLTWFILMMTLAIFGLMTVGYDRTQSVIKSAMSILTLGLLGFFINGIWGWI